MLNKQTIYEALFLLKNKRFPQEINSVVFLLHKPIGLGSEENVITRDNEEFTEFIDCVTREGHNLKIGFDSCTVPMLVNNIGNIDMDCLDTCEGVRFVLRSMCVKIKKGCKYQFLVFYVLYITFPLHTL